MLHPASFFLIYFGDCSRFIQGDSPCCFNSLPLFVYSWAVGYFQAFAMTPGLLGTSCSLVINSLARLLGDKSLKPELPSLRVCTLVMWTNCPGQRLCLSFPHCVWRRGPEPGCYLLQSSNTHPHAPISGAPRASPVSSLLTFRSAHKCHLL